MPAFLTPVSYSAGVNPGGIAVGDFNDDGRDDMAVVNQAAAGTVTVLLSNADGTFAPGVSYAAGSSPIAAAAGDLNGDGKVDLVTVGTGVNVLLGNGDGTFGAPASFAGSLATHSVQVGDFNNDGKLDVGAVGFNGAAVLLGNGDGALQNPISTTVFGNNINLVVGDYDHDGRLDMATSNTTSVGTVSVLKGRGDGTFNPVETYAAFSAPVYLAGGDFNGDGYDDFVVANSYAQTSMSVIMNNGDGTYAAPHTYGIAETGFEIEAADFNHDGNEDFAVRGANEYMVHLGKGDGTFYPEVTYQVPGGQFEKGTHGDFNGDGAVDLAFPTFGGQVAVATNDNSDAQSRAGAVTFEVAAPATTTSGSVLPMTVTAVDANGNAATGFRGTVYISSSDPAATTAAGYAFNPLDAGIPYVFTAADAGSHTFTGAIRLVTGGDQTVTAAAPNMTPATTTVTVTGQVTHLAFGAPTAASAGDTFQVTVSALDAVGAVATGYSSTIRFSSSDVRAGLPADYTFTAADAGTHTFTVTLKSSGLQSIGAKEVGGAIGGGTNVGVTPGAAVGFSLAGAGGAIGVVRPFAVVARDAFGNVATSYNGTVRITSSDPAAVLPPDTTLVNGAATADVTLMTVGTQTITATDVTGPALTGTASSDATPPVAALFQVTGYPATTAGAANTFAVTVRDTIGRIATGYTGTIFFSSSDVQAGLPASYTFTAADAGARTFTATFRTAGAQSIAARDAAGLTGTEAGIVVTPAAFAGFRVSTPVANPEGMLVTADTVVPITVRAVDAFGNTVTGYTGKVHFTSTDAQATLPADYAFTAADAGTRTFSVGLHTATPRLGSWSVGVVDTKNVATLATVAGFEVVNGAAVRVVLNPPSNVTAGTPFALKVTVLDAWGNPVKNYFGTIHFGDTAGPLGLPPDYTFTAADAGVASITVTLNTTGNQTLSVTDTTNSALKASAALSVKAPSITGGGGGGGGSTGGGGTGGGGGGKKGGAA
ncbi:MAG: VCBS repeat-containing protein [Planctomycetes bacterium]|nr:VCBS repeat-containing protein [Planctomycetota bacterium]